MTSRVEHTAQVRPTPLRSTITLRLRQPDAAPPFQLRIAAVKKLQCIASFRQGSGARFETEGFASAASTEVRGSFQYVGRRLATAPSMPSLPKVTRNAFLLGIGIHATYNVGVVILGGLGVLDFLETAILR